MNKSTVCNCITCPTRSQSALSDVPDELITELLSLKISNIYHKGQAVYYEGNRSFGVYCLKNGRIKLSKSGPEGKDLIVHIAKDGDLLGYRSFFTNELHSSTAEALEDTTVCFLEREKFFELLKKHPPFSLKLLSIMGQSIKSAENNSASMAYKSTNERILEMLLFLKDTYGVKYDDNTYKIDLALSRNDLSSLIGTSVETSVRLLTWLKEEKLVKTENKYLYITDLKKLQKLIPEY